MARRRITTPPSYTIDEFAALVCRLRKTPKALANVEQASDWLGLSVRTIYNRLHFPEGHRLRLGGAPLGRGTGISYESIYAYLKRRSRGTDVEYLFEDK